MPDALVERLDQTIDRLLARQDATAALGDAELSRLATLATELRWCPSLEFKARLRASLQRRTTMVMALDTARIREGFTTVTPYLRVPDSGLFEFLTKAFGALETSMTKAEGDNVHREVRVGDSMLMIGEGNAQGTPGFAPAAFQVYVPDVDTVFARAIAAGGTQLGAPEDRFYGERSGFVEDPLGNHWYISTPIPPRRMPQGHRMVTPFIHARGAASYIDFLQRAFGAIERERHEDAGVIRHAVLQVGGSAIDMGESEYVEPMKATFYLYVPDCDAVYEQAIAAGATRLSPPADQWYGDRLASVRDPLGITWYIARPA